MYTEEELSNFYLNSSSHQRSQKSSILAETEDCGNTYILTERDGEEEIPELLYMHPRQLPKTPTKNNRNSRKRYDMNLILRLIGYIEDSLDERLSNIKQLISDNKSNLHQARKEYVGVESRVMELNRKAGTGSSLISDDIKFFFNLVKGNKSPGKSKLALRAGDLGRGSGGVRGAGGKAGGSGRVSSRQRSRKNSRVRNGVQHHQKARGAQNGHQKMPNRANSRVKGRSRSRLNQQREAVKKSKIPKKPYDKGRTKENVNPNRRQGGQQYQKSHIQLKQKNRPIGQNFRARTPVKNRSEQLRKSRQKGVVGNLENSASDQKNRKKFFIPKNPYANKYNDNIRRTPIKNSDRCVLRNSGAKLSSRGRTPTPEKLPSKPRLGPNGTRVSPLGRRPSHKNHHGYLNRPLPEPGHQKSGWKHRTPKSRNRRIPGQRMERGDSKSPDSTSKTLVFNYGGQNSRKKSASKRRPSRPRRGSSSSIGAARQDRAGRRRDSSAESTKMAYALNASNNKTQKRWEMLYNHAFERENNRRRDSEQFYRQDDENETLENRKTSTGRTAKGANFRASYGHIQDAEANGGAQQWPPAHKNHKRARKRRNSSFHKKAKNQQKQPPRGHPVNHSDRIEHKRGQSISEVQETDRESIVFSQNLKTVENQKLVNSNDFIILKDSNYGTLNSSGNGVFQAAMSTKKSIQTEELLNHKKSNFEEFSLSKGDNEAENHIQRTEGSQEDGRMIPSLNIKLPGGGKSPISMSLQIEDSLKKQVPEAETSFLHPGRELYGNLTDDLSDRSPAKSTKNRNLLKIKRNFKKASQRHKRSKGSRNGSYQASCEYYESLDSSNGKNQSQKGKNRPIEIRIDSEIEDRELEYNGSRKLPDEPGAGLDSNLARIRSLKNSITKEELFKMILRTDESGASGLAAEAPFRRKEALLEEQGRGRLLTDESRSSHSGQRRSSARATLGDCEDNEEVGTTRRNTNATSEESSSRVPSTRRYKESSAPESSQRDLRDLRSSKTKSGNSSKHLYDGFQFKEDEKSDRSFRKNLKLLDESFSKEVAYIQKQNKELNERLDRNPDLWKGVEFGKIEVTKMLHKVMDSTDLGTRGELSGGSRGSRGALGLGEGSRGGFGVEENLEKSDQNVASEESETARNVFKRYQSLDKETKEEIYRSMSEDERKKMLKNFEDLETSLARQGITEFSDSLGGGDSGWKSLKKGSKCTQNQSTKSPSKRSEISSNQQSMSNFMSFNDLGSQNKLIGDNTITIIQEEQESENHSNRQKSQKGNSKRDLEVSPKRIRAQKERSIAETLEKLRRIQSEAGSSRQPSDHNSRREAVDSMFQHSRIHKEGSQSGKKH